MDTGLGGDTRLIGLSQETKFGAETKLSLEGKKCEIRNFFFFRVKKCKNGVHNTAAGFVKLWPLPLLGG